MEKVKTAIIFDLDNTIYPVSSIGEMKFGDLFKLIEEDARYKGNLEDIKTEIQQTPFQYVAEEYQFHDELVSKSIHLLKDLEYKGPIKPFEDYKYIKDLNCRKFLVTAGFTKLQWSKIKLLELDKSFEECFVIDPELTDKSKKDVFVEIMEKYNLKPNEVLVVGDDIASEIRGGNELGVDTVLYDFTGKYSGSNENDGNIIDNHGDLEDYL